MFYVFLHLVSTYFLSVNWQSPFFVVSYFLEIQALSKTLLIGTQLVQVRRSMVFVLLKGDSIATSSCVSFSVSANKLSHIYGMLGQGTCQLPNWLLINKDNVHFSNFNAKFHCEICPLAKQIRLPFNTSTHISNECFDLIHCDLWDPFLFPPFMVVDSFNYC